MICNSVLEKSNPMSQKKKLAKFNFWRTFYMNAASEKQIFGYTTFLKEIKRSKNFFFVCLEFHVKTSLF